MLNLKYTSRTKLALYKTAWSPTYQSYIEIIKVRYDDNDEPIIDGRIPANVNEPERFVMFRVCELREFCL